jgi:PAS domain S-box-containing protein
VANVRELDAERRTLRAVLETAPLGILLYDDEHRLRMINRAGARLVGVSDDGLDVEDLEKLALETAERGLFQPIQLDDLRKQIDDDPSCVIKDLEFIAGKNGEVCLDVFSAPVSSESGERIGRIWIFHDVSKEHRLQRQLQQAQKMETLATLAGGVAHDFNNQLTTILGNAHIAMEESVLADAVVRDCLQDLERAAEHCAELTTGLLAFARRVPVEPHAVQIEPVVREVESLLRAMIPRSVELQVEIEEGLRPALADPARLEQVLLNLAINARDAVESGGTVRIRVRNRSFVPSRRSRALGRRAGRFLEFAVRDTGTGIDPETRERIFDPFFTTKEVGRGTGLGLAIVYGIVHSHEGWVDVESQVGKGTTIRVYIPAAESEVEIDQRDLDRPLPGGDATVLVAEDDDGVRRLAVHTLKRLGYRTIEARDGDEAVELFEEHRNEIDMAMLDLTMPGRGGVEALAEIRRLEPELPVLMVSGFLDGPDRIRSQKGVQFLPKPYRPEVLGRAVRDALNRSGGGG